MTGAGADRGRRVPILLVGMGNTDRGDDAVGPVIADRLAGSLPADVTVMRQNGDALALIDAWAGYDAAILVDAAVSGAGPGRIHRIDAVADALPSHLSLSSTHAFGLADAIALARVLERLPRAVIIYAVEAACFDGGSPLTPAVANAVPDVVARIRTEVRTLRCRRGDEPCMRPD